MQVSEQQRGPSSVPCSKTATNHTNDLLQTTRQQRRQRVAAVNKPRQQQCIGAEVAADTTPNLLGMSPPPPTTGSQPRRSRAATASDVSRAVIHAPSSSSSLSHQQQQQHSRPRGCPTAGPPGVSGTQAEEWQSQFFKTKLCPYHLEGRCINGSACRFAHTADELRPLPDLHRTKLCESYVKKEICRQPGCPFAHNPCELRTSSHSFYKVTLCNFYKKGRCWNGVHCRFAHGTSELQVAMAQQDQNHAPTDPAASLATTVSMHEGAAESLARQHTWDSTSKDPFPVKVLSPPTKIANTPPPLEARITRKTPPPPSGLERRQSDTMIASAETAASTPTVTATTTVTNMSSVQIPPTGSVSSTGQSADMQTLTVTLMRLLNLPNVEDSSDAAAPVAAGTTSQDQAPNEAWLTEFLKKLSVTRDLSPMKDGGASGIPSLLDLPDTTLGSSAQAFDSSSGAPAQPSLCSSTPVPPPFAPSTQESVGLLPSLSNLIFSSALARSPTAAETVRQVAAAINTHATEEELDALSPGAAKHFFPLSLGQLVGLIDSDEVSPHTGETPLRQPAAASEVADPTPATAETPLLLTVQTTPKNGRASSDPVSFPTVQQQSPVKTPDHRQQPAPLSSQHGLSLGATSSPKASHCVAAVTQPPLLQMYSIID